jgi:hypothetical protein
MDRAIARAARKRALALPPGRVLGTTGPDWRAECGCAMGARFLAGALLISTIWYAWRWESSDLSVSAALARTIVWSLLAATAGKIVGIVASRKRRHASY